MKRDSMLQGWRISIFAGLLLAVALFCANMQPAQAGRMLDATTTPTPGGFIIRPDKPAATPSVKLEPNLIVLRHYTIPERPQVQKRFTLAVELQNLGGASAEDWFIRSAICTTSSEMYAIDPCTQSLPPLAVGSAATVYFNLVFPAGEEGDKKVGLVFEAQHEMVASTTEQVQVPIYLYSADPTPDPAWTFAHPKPDLFVRNWWTAQAGATGDDLYWSISVADKNPFELVLDLQNLGQVEAYNIRIDFCTKGAGVIQPAGAGCYQYIPTGLHPGDHATATQTVAFEHSSEDVQPYTIVITYEHQFEGQAYTRSEEEVLYIVRKDDRGLALTADPPGSVGGESVGLASTGTDETVLAEPHLVVQTVALNIRSGPGTEYPIVGATSQGHRLPLLGRNGDGSWWQIDVQGNPAWVYGGLVDAIGAANIPVALYVPPLPATPTVQTASLPNPFPSALLAVANLAQEATQTESRDLPLAQASADLVGVPITGNSTRGPTVIIESYQTRPERPVVGEPFLLHLALRNVGDETAQRIIVQVGEGTVVPIGSGAASFASSLTAGERGLHVRQLMVSDPTSSGVVSVPMEMLYTDSKGESLTRPEQIGILLGSSEPVPGQVVSTPRPLLLRLVLGLLGLGAGPK